MCLMAPIIMYNTTTIGKLVSHIQTHKIGRWNEFFFFIFPVYERMNERLSGFIGCFVAVIIISIFFRQAYRTAKYMQNWPLQFFFSSSDFTILLLLLLLLVVVVVMMIDIYTRKKKTNEWCEQKKKWWR